jgi:hypothetical protein
MRKSGFSLRFPTVSLGGPMTSITSRSFRWLATAFIACSIALTSAIAYFDTARAQDTSRLSQRERTFLNFVLSGDEAKATEFVRAAGINPNMLAGEPLSAWFYRSFNSSGPSNLRSLPVQRIVFETFKQNPNPANVADNSNLQNFCTYAPFPNNIQIQVNGTPAQRDAFRESQVAALKGHIDQMATSFESLLRYGLKDRRIITNVFMGCAFRGATNLGDGMVNTYAYDTLLAKMIRAGADINAETIAAQRPIQYAVERGFPDIVERLLRDGAQTNFVVRMSGSDRPNPAVPCAPRLLTSLYIYAYQGNWAKTKNPEAVVRIVKSLASRNISAMTAYGSLANDGSGRCIYKSFYDSVLDTGNIQFATAIKAAATKAVEQRPGKPAAPSPPPTAQPSSAPIERPAQIGDWRIVQDNGRPMAIAKADKIDGDHLAGLHLVCVPGGRLEYVTSALKLFEPMRALWINRAGDVYRITLTNAHARGADAVAISKHLLAEEEGNKGNPDGDKLLVQMSVDSDNGPMSNIQMTGFSKMRAYMLANCKS